MSDTIDELWKRYQENVPSDEHSRSIGLFPIPEYPEYEERGMWSTALEAILTTLRYLAPATLLTIFWGQQSFLFKLLKHIDSAFRAIVFSSDEQKQAVLKWLAEVGPVRVEHLDTVWRHGWILCGVLDAALPGACAGHPPTKLSLKHAQAIADHYLGVEPIFSRQELESSDSLSKHQEWKLATYLDRIRLALSKLTPAVSRPVSQRTSPEIKPEPAQVTLDYVARGSGLTAAQVNQKVYFKIYPTAQQALDPGEITILIRGPKDAYGMFISPPILGKAQMIRQNLLGLQSKSNYTENALPITQGATYLRNYGKNDMNKTYYIPKTKYDIEIETENRKDHMRVGYTVNCLGKYEISITSRGLNIAGSPFKVTGSNNILNILEKESFCLEDGEEIDIVDIKTDRKVVLRIVDFVTEKMLLRENGCLEKITDEEAKYLMETDIVNIENSDFKKKFKNDCSSAVKSHEKNIRFNSVANKILKLNKVCKVFNDLKHERLYLTKEKQNRTIPTQQGIPDIVNSTLNETKLPFMVGEKQGRVIIPENISVSLMTEKSKAYQEDEKSLTGSDSNTEVMFNSPDYLEKYKILRDPFEDDEMSVQSSNNPFINDMYTEDYTTEKKLGAFIATEYETNNSQNEETEDETKIFIHTEPESSCKTPNNPFIDVDPATLDRPKSPVFKCTQQDSQTEDISDDILGNEFINPFFTHHHQSNQYNEALPVTNFIIGAPVSLPPIVRTTSPDTNLESILVSADDILNAEKNRKSDPSTSSGISSESSTFNTNLPGCSDSSGPSSRSNEFYQNKTSNIPLPSPPAKKDMWDSAYVSIDDNNSSPDNNNNDNSLPEPLSKQQFPPSDELSTMGPAEREIWESCSELKEPSIFRTHEETRTNKWDSKLSIFTPIIEETGMKDYNNDDNEDDPVTIAFSELNEIFDDYQQSDNSSTTSENNKLQNLEIEYTTERNDICVDSASELTDVKRHAQELEGSISEVQASVTESNSASQILHVTESNNHIQSENKDETQFGESKHSNIVLERKKYWDEKIRQIQAKSDEMKAQQKKRRLSTKPLKHNDSLSKKKGKQMIKNFLNASEDYQKHSKPVNVKQADIPVAVTEEPLHDQPETDVKLVEKWKSYWDNKLEIEKELEKTTKRPKSSQSYETPKPIETLVHSFENISDLHTTLDPDFESSLPSKQELPEEVFRAFETSPKRFFGTSRKQILNKIDTFLGKPNVEENRSSELSGLNRESGLVSSRISLFHSISRTEELPWARRKCQSLHNIHQQKDTEKNIAPKEANVPNEDNDKDDFTSLDTFKTGEPDIISIGNIQNDNEVISREDSPEIDLKTCHSLDETTSTENNSEKKKNYVKMAIKEFNDHSQPDYGFQPSKLKTSISKSEMDIFSKVSNKSSEEDLDKHKSYEELPKINVKSFISMYEGVSKSSLDTKKVQSRKNVIELQNQLQVAGSDSGTVKEIKYTKLESSPEESLSRSESNTSSNSQKTTLSRNVSPDSASDSIDIEIISNPDKENTYLSLSDIDLEIVENSPITSPDSTPERKVVTANVEYKSRFQMAKQYFQSLEELREQKKTRKLNECEMLLYGAENESPTNDNARRQTGKTKKKKSNSLPTSEIAKAWKQLQDTQDSEGSSKMVKISEKFNVDDLFNDVMEGRLSRQGSLRGIPHKKAVLEAFKSMENITDKKLSPYEMAVSQLNEFAKENKIRNAQTYLSEYPYLPTTDPSKYHSRVDANASGLISYKEILESKPRRNNSVPDLRLNPAFTVDL